MWTGSAMSTALTQSELQISVLVVEDENLTRALMSKLLTTSGFRVVGSAGYKSIQSKPDNICPFVLS